MEVVTGTPLISDEFVLKLTGDEIAIIAYALMLQAGSSALPPNAWVRQPSEELSYKFANLVGIH